MWGVGKGDICGAGSVWHLHFSGGNRVWSKQVLGWQVTSTSKIWFLQAKNFGVWVLAYWFLCFPLLVTVCKFRNLQSSSSYWCFTPLWKGNCYLAPKTEMALAAQTCHCMLCGPGQLPGGSVGDGCSEWLFLSCTHTCTRSKSAAVFESGRVVRRKDVMALEAKMFTCSVFSTTSYFDLH